jgi:hypothetical protein
MNTRGRLVLAGAIVLAVVLLVGWFWGASGRRAAERQLAEAELRLDWLSARGRLLQARVDLFELNFGSASRELAASRQPLQDLAGRLERDNRRAEAESARHALTRAEEAHQLLGELDQTANPRIAQAIQTLDAIAITPR